MRALKIILIATLRIAAAWQPVQPSRIAALPRRHALSTLAATTVEPPAPPPPPPPPPPPAPPLRGAGLLRSIEARLETLGGDPQALYEAVVGLPGPSTSYDRDVLVDFWNRRPAAMAGRVFDFLRGKTTVREEKPAHQQPSSSLLRGNYIIVENHLHMPLPSIGTSAPLFLFA